MAVILADGPWRIIDEARLLADLSSDRSIEDGLDIQAHPAVPRGAWDEPSLHPNPATMMGPGYDGGGPDDRDFKGDADLGYSDHSQRRDDPGLGQPFAPTQGHQVYRDYQNQRHQ